MFTQAIWQNLVLCSIEGMSRSRFCSYLRESLRFDYADAESRRRIQQGRLREVLAAAQRTELYQQALAAPLPSQLADASLNGQRMLHIRPITKAEFRRHFPTGTFSRKPDNDWRYLSTSGTTDRLSVVADFIKRDFRRSNELRGMQIAVGASVGLPTVEIPPNSCNVVCGIDDADQLSLWQILRQGVQNRSLFHSKTLTDLRGRFERDILLRKRTLAPLEPAPGDIFTRQLDRTLASILRFNPRILRGYPLYLLWLADRASQTRMTFPNLTHILPYGGLTSPRMIQRIESGFQAAFRNVYGTSELGLMAAACGQSPGMHLFEDLFHVEIDAGSPTNGNHPGPLIVTDLVNTAMPIVRYQVGDVGRLHQQTCPCGRKTPRVEVMGRIQEALQIQVGMITASEVADTFFTDPGIANGRVDEVAPGCFEAALMPVPEGPNPDLAAWENRFRGLFAAPIKRVRSKIVPFLRPETSGKYLMVWPMRSSSRNDR